MDGQLLSFRVSNHRSLHEEQELSLIATDKGDARLLLPNGLEEAVVPVCAMYGANASGKSNVMHALAFMQQAVVLSQRLWTTEGVPRERFALTDDPAAPSAFSLQMVIEGARYEYGFAVDDEVVLEEWLYAWPNGRKQEWFTRDRQVFHFNRELHGENKAIEALTRPNSLFLSAAAQNNHPRLGSLYRWFASRLRVSHQTLGWTFGTSQGWEQFAEGSVEQLSFLQPSEELLHRRTRVRTLLRAADLGIQDFRVTEEDAPQRDSRGDLRRPRKTWRLSFSHLGASPGTWLDLAQQSTGTRALVSLLSTLLPILDSGGVIAIDELNTLHPMLALALVQLFQDATRNPRGAQLLFNTHESSLLGNLLADPPPLRRDQIWLTEKDRTGATHLYPLTDYKPRAAENLERGYLQGRYGAVAFPWRLRGPAAADGRVTCPGGFEIAIGSSLDADQAKTRSSES
ncbi:MAG: ATP-binding protein [Myxococcales bacterium]|nr:ATP-binding protein [Myxococcales bacterium]